MFSFKSSVTYRYQYKNKKKIVSTLFAMNHRLLTNRKAKVMMKNESSRMKTIKHGRNKKRLFFGNET